MSRRQVFALGSIAAIGLAGFGAWMVWGPSSAGHDPLSVQGGLVGIAFTTAIGGAPVVLACGVLTAPGPPTRRRTATAVGLLLLGAVLGMIVGGLAHGLRWEGEFL